MIFTRNNEVSITNKLNYTKKRDYCYFILYTIGIAFLMKLVTAYS